MVRFFLPLLFVTVLWPCAWAQTPPVTVANAGEAEAQRCEDRIASVQRDVLNRYETSLQELQAGFQKAADLEGALAVRAERQRLGQENSLTSANFINDPKSLRALQVQTITRLQELVSQLVDDTLPRLIELKRGLTVAGRLDEAVAVRSSIERLQNRFQPGGPPPAGTVVPADTLIRAYLGDRGRADSQYKGQRLLVRGTIAGYRADPDGRHYNIYLGGTTAGVTGWVQCAFATSEYRTREDTQFGNSYLTISWGKDSSLRLQRGGSVDISGQGGGWDETVRLNKCEFPK